MAASLLLSLLASAAPFIAPLQPEAPRVVPQAAEAGRHVWHSRTFRLDSDSPLPERQLQRLAQVADTTAAAVRAFPLPLHAPPRAERPRIAIHDDEDSYLAAGAHPDTAGSYNPKLETVLIHAEHLFRADPSGRLAPAVDEDLVVHELVHLCMHRAQRRLPQWLFEGIAEYFAAAHRGAGRFDFSHLEEAIVGTLRDRLHTRERIVTLVPIADLAGLDGDEWNTYLESMPAGDRYRAYATGLLLTHYHLHGSQARRDAVQAALETSTRRRRSREPVPNPFPDLKSGAADIEAALTAYWKPRGLDLQFAPTESRDPVPSTHGEWAR